MSLIVNFGMLQVSDDSETRPIIIGANDCAALEGRAVPNDVLPPSPEKPGSSKQAKTNRSGSATSIDDISPANRRGSNGGRQQGADYDVPSIISVVSATSDASRNESLGVERSEVPSRRNSLLYSTLASLRKLRNMAKPSSSKCDLPPRGEIGAR